MSVPRKVNVNAKCFSQDNSVVKQSEFRHSKKSSPDNSVIIPNIKTW